VEKTVILTKFDGEKSFRRRRVIAELKRIPPGGSIRSYTLGITKEF